MINQALGIIENASAHGGEVDHLLELVHWLMLVLFVGWTTFFIYAIIRFRKSKNPKADYAGVTSHKSTYLEVVVVVLEAVLLLGFAFPLWGKRVNQFPSEKDTVSVRVIAKQFSWEIYYPGPDGIFGKRSPSLVTKDNSIGLDKSDPAAQDDLVAPEKDMHLPVDKSAIVHVTSKDVIHSFAIRQMRVVQDTIPGMDIPLWFKPIKTGKFEIACAQLCGTSHASMRGVLTVESQEEYNRWLGTLDKAASGSGNIYE